MEFKKTETKYDELTEKMFKLNEEHRKRFGFFVGTLFVDVEETVKGLEKALETGIPYEQDDDDLPPGAKL